MRTVRIPDKPARCAGVEDAIALFNAQSISCIPIVDAENQVLGIIRWGDIMKHFHDIEKSLS